MKVKDEGEDGGDPRPRAVCGVVRMVGLGARIYRYIDRCQVDHRIVAWYTPVYICVPVRVEPAKNAIRPLPACVQLQAYKVR